jgi:hypothetical protein
MGRVKVLAVKRGVFAHHHRVKIFQCGAVLRGGVEPNIGLSGQGDLAHLGGHRLALLPTHIGHLTRGNFVAAFLCFTHHRKRGVLVDLEGFQRVGNKEYFHVGHCRGALLRLS